MTLAVQRVREVNQELGVEISPEPEPRKQRGSRRRGSNSNFWVDLPPFGISGWRLVGPPGFAARSLGRAATQRRARILVGPTN